MKIKYFINFVLILLIFVNSNSKAETIFFDSKNIKIEENGDMVFATKGIAKIPSKNLNIEGDKFVYDKKNFELTIFDNVKYLDEENDIIIESEKLIYDQLKNTVLSQSKTFIKIENKYDINSNDVLFDRKLNKISSRKFTDVSDQTDNKL